MPHITMDAHADSLAVSPIHCIQLFGKVHKLTILLLVILWFVKL